MLVKERTGENCPSRKPAISADILRLEIVPAAYGRFTAWLGNREVCTSTEPLCETARILLAEGFNPKTVIEMYHAGSTTLALRARLGAAARLTVVDNDEGTPVFARWQPRGWKRW